MKKSKPVLNYRMMKNISEGKIRFSNGSVFDYNDEIWGWKWNKEKFPALIIKFWDKDNFLENINKESLEKILK